MVKIKVDGQQLEVRSGVSIISACERYVGGILSRYCYSERLGVSGNCRMCVVEVAGMAKVVLGCVERVREGMEIFTRSARINKVREGVMELLLVNHPLDCPVCDQGGECDLQEEAVRVGASYGRLYGVDRRGVVEKEISVVVSGSMKRCIQCSRCVRYGEKMGIGYGMIGRGNGVEVVREGLRMDGMEGNVVDLCPVGKQW